VTSSQNISGAALKAAAESNQLAWKRELVSSRNMPFHELRSFVHWQEKACGTNHIADPFKLHL